MLGCVAPMVLVHPGRTMHDEMTSQLFRTLQLLQDSARLRGGVALVVNETVRLKEEEALAYALAFEPSPYPLRAA